MGKNCCPYLFNGNLFIAGISGSWAQAVYDFTPFPWMYKFTYLKYLFIVIPGSIAGEYLKEWMVRRNKESVLPIEADRRFSFFFLALTISVIILNLCFLQSRLVQINLVITSVLLVFGCFLLRKADSNYQKLWKDLFYAGAYLLILGLFFESYEGGIKKDPPSYSYYFCNFRTGFYGSFST